MLRIVATLALVTAVVGGSAAHAVWRGQVPMLTEPAPAPAEVSTTPTSGPAPSEEPELLGVVVPTMEVTVSTPTQAQIEQVLVRLGQRVEPGEPLATIDTSLARHDLDAARARRRALDAQRQQVAAELAGAEDRRDRSQRLGAMVPAQERRQLELEVEATRARLGRVRAEASEIRVQIDKLEQIVERGQLVAPFGGVIAGRHVDPGARVTGGEAVVDLMSEATQIRLAAPARLGLRPADRLAARCEGAQGVRQIEVERVAPQLDAASRMLLVEGRLVTGTAAIGTVCRLSAPRPMNP